MRKLIYNLKWRQHHPKAFARFAEIMRHEHLPLEQLLEQQESARKRIVTNAYNNTQFYRQHYSSVGFELGDMEKPGWFEKLPIITKQHLRDHFDDFVNPPLRQFLRISTTGGSTGTPTKTGYDGRLEDEIYSWRLQSRFGINPWDDHAYVWRDTRNSALAKFKNAVQWWPTRHLKLDATFMTPESIEAFLQKFYRIRPTLLQGYVGAITQIAEYVNKHQSSTSTLNFNSNLKAVWTTSAPLSPIQRKLIEDAFHAPICDEYGSCELRWIACQCAECKGLHVNTEHVHIEFVDDNNIPVPRGEYGRTLLTNLEDTVFPLIRYENNDRGRWLIEPCSCGRTLPCIDSVKGRISESFVLPSGKTINGEYLTTIFDATPDLVRGFRVIQHKDLSITIEYIPSSTSASTINVLNAFAARLGNEVPIDFKQVPSIPHDRGKLRFVIKER